MEKSVLIEYCDMQVEIKELKKLIKVTEEKIAKMEEKERTRDVVSGGAGGTQHFKVEGFPIPEYTKVKRLLISRRERLKMKEEELLEITNQAEEYIESIKRSEIRIMFRMRYIEGLTWNQVAHQMNEMFSRTKRTYTEDGCRMKGNRFFKETEGHKVSL